MKKVFFLVLSLLLISCQGQESRKNVVKKNKMENKLAYATIGGGCFWCVESCFNMLKGVHSVTSGYSGGHTDNPTYEEVCTGETGHAEVVQIAYDPSVISYKQLMEVFLFLHDPTQLNRQGNDIGTQYRSVVFYNSEEQKKETEEALKASEEKKEWSGKYVTQVVPFEKFWPAETYHQGYYKANPNQPYCSAVVGPKIQKFKKHFGEKGWLKPEEN
ncbi:peptide-methionine (S)-S-oxide reductase MsrA [Elizabethkingia meningoseptica]|uniref:peptide-methionine (S)-S-oxide reductase MsrA n=1 Tax=Elizabethkingia meningoseptica TaxID=238 RepID=UPI0009995EC2|nr:peptide-methionine (S)-S-oxide reductase MsrA [Elizabethkingia meningoseptica]EJK5330747.1 peptide-methionine (S)-S-oxide reductase MsrA [Elizabethkingia meningoseptica]MDE5469801.1 peptide-methionine (S)-S-oxide reductase MsrA [Elizabethkingia meningoseptica]MDE5476745.1 peptide-methionine (S)-S-oxide reductase MsrA [Elizabethkingia meningoseptica]MDE5480144.1 peptide-methionine (S)-S-oxide reductase MsrA [Elizabethkingia meningoseptica]MDE5487210.1 peptide-methionine (S)-S-oxide reductase